MSDSASVTNQNASCSKQTNNEEDKTEQTIRLCRNSDSNGAYEQDGNKITEQRYHKKWNRRFKYAFCCLGYERNKDSISDVAAMFAGYFADLKVSSSDIAAGMVMLSKFQAAQQKYIVKTKQDGIEQFLSAIPIKANTEFLDLTRAQDSHLMNDLIYFMRYSLAIFGWPLHMYENPCYLWCIFRHMRCCSCCTCRRKQRTEPNSTRPNKDKNNNIDHHVNGDVEREHQIADDDKQFDILEDNNLNPIIEEDNCCGCNWVAAEQRLDELNSEIIYITYHSDIGIVPFLVAIDHTKQTVVVSIRGSMNLSDALTDMLGQADPVPIECCPSDWLGHRGMTRAALYIKNKLLNDKILEKAFNCRPDLGSQDYNLLLCGHSLGAGVAAILGVLMRSIYPGLRAYLYSPPGGILSLPVVEYTKQFAIGVILANDAVARLGLAQMERLRYHALLSLKNTDRSTGRVLARALCPKFCFGDNSIEYDPGLSIDLLQANQGQPFEYQGNVIPFQTSPLVMYVPGRLIHIVRNELKVHRSGKRSNMKQPIYQAVWSTDVTIYDRLIICKGMFSDHMPNRLMDAMKMLLVRTIPDRRNLVMEAQNHRIPNESRNIINQNDAIDKSKGDASSI